MLDRIRTGPAGFLASTVALAACVLLYACRPAESPAQPVVVRVATFNVEDVRTEDLLRDDQPRIRLMAEILQRLRPDIVLINEMAYDQEGARGFDPAAGPGRNAERFVSRYLARGQGDGLEPLHYSVVMLPSNTGLASGFDLDNDQLAVTTVPDVPGPNADGTPGPQTPGGRAYGNDSWGFGMFPGQYAMALLVSDSLQILRDRIRSFQQFKWSDMPGALVPVDPETGERWYNEEEWRAMRLSSKTHMDVPVLLPNKTVLHLLCSHPTPPAFDGPEHRNRLRNHDEIRFWTDYLSGAAYMVDDKGVRGGFEGTSFVLLGDLNADPDEGSTHGDPIDSLLFALPMINSRFVPVSADSTAGLDPDDTASWGLRADYVLPSTDLDVVRGGIYRYRKGNAPSDHFPVWLDLSVPARADTGPK